MKKLIFLTGSTLFFLSIAVITGCEKDVSLVKETVTTFSSDFETYIVTDRDLLSYVFYNGTYWVYENDSTSVRDSVTVTATGNPMHLVGGEHGLNGWWVEEYIVYTKDHSGFRALDFHISPHIISLYEYGPGVPSIYTPYKQPYSLDFDVELVAVHDTLTVNGNEFYQVSEFLYPYFIFNYPNQEERTRYYWANNYGIIKKQEEHDSLGVTATWNLDNWNIVQ